SGYGGALRNDKGIILALFSGLICAFDAKLVELLSIVVPPHTTRITQPLPDLYHAPEPEPEPEPVPVPKTKLHSRDSSYHLELGGDDYFAASYPPQYSAPFNPYLPSYSSPPGSSSSMAFDT
ncbi:hypothetical protein Gotri_027247, partial [Gossypium trilobum]|nr:hypothetical protein [Gossypium trilobum]